MIFAGDSIPFLPLPKEANPPRTVGSPGLHLLSSHGRSESFVPSRNLSTVTQFIDSLASSIPLPTRLTRPSLSGCLIQSPWSALDVWVSPLSSIHLTFLRRLHRVATPPLFLSHSPHTTHFLFANYTHTAQFVEHNLKHLILSESTRGIRSLLSSLEPNRLKSHRTKDYHLQRGKTSTKPYHQHSTLKIYNMNSLYTLAWGCSPVKFP